jgi:hypothetical protein
MNEPRDGTFEFLDSTASHVICMTSAGKPVHGRNPKAGTSATSLTSPMRYLRPVSVVSYCPAADMKEGGEEGEENGPQEVASGNRSQRHGDSFVVSTDCNEGAD